MSASRPCRERKSTAPTARRARGRAGHDAAQRPARRHRGHAAARDGLARRLDRRRHAPRAARASRASPICSSTWPSRARSRRNALAIVEEIEAVGGDLNAETSVERTSYYARVLGENVPLALDILSDILTEPAFDKDELKREKGVVLQEIGACEDTPGRPRLRHVHGDGLSAARRSAGASSARRRPCAPRPPARCAASWTGSTAAPEMVVAAAGAVDHDAVVEEVARRFAALRREPAPPPVAGPLYRRRGAQGAQAGAGASRAGLRGPRRSTTRDHYTPARVLQPAGRRHVLAAVPGDPREARAVLRDLLLPPALLRHRRLRHLWRHRRGRCSASSCPCCSTACARRPSDPTEAEVARAKAQIKVSLLMGLEVLGAPGRADGAPRPRLRPRDPARGDRGGASMRSPSRTSAAWRSPCWRRRRPSAPSALCAS